MFRGVLVPLGKRGGLAFTVKLKHHRNFVINLKFWKTFCRVAPSDPVAPTVKISRNAYVYVLLFNLFLFLIKLSKNPMN